MGFFDWLGAAGSGYQVLAGLLVAALVALIVQFVGLDGAGDTDADAGDGDGPAIFTLRNFTAFALGFSLVTLLVAHTTGRDLLAVGAGLTTGLGFVAVNMALLATLARLSENGTMKLDALVGATGRVTVPVPGSGATGKALFVGPRSQTVELPVVSDCGALTRGTQVRLMRLAGEIAVVTTIALAPEALD
jgi:hypothetical protein